MPARRGGHPAAAAVAATVAMNATQVSMFTAPARLILAFTLLLWAPYARATVTLDEPGGSAPRRTASSIISGVAPHSAQTRRRRLLEVSSSPLRHELPQLDDGGLHKAKPAVPKPPKRWDVCVVGAGLSGGVVAERLASVLDKSVLVIERRRHIAGNCYDYAEEETGLRINLYGPHNFHTNSEDAWKYINKFGRWVHYRRRRCQRRQRHRLFARASWSHGRLWAEQQIGPCLSSWQQRTCSSASHHHLLLLGTLRPPGLCSGI